MKKSFLMILILLFIPMLGWSVVRAPGAMPSTKDVRTEFWQAVVTNDVTRAKKALRKDKSLVFASQNGRTGYLLAVEKGNKKMAWFLVESFSRLNASCERGNALHIAVENQDFGMIKLVMKAAQDEDEELLTRLINSPRLTAKQGQNKADMNTPLHIAALLCDRDIYNYLVSFDGNEKARNANFQTPKEILETCPPEPKEKPKKENKD